MAETVWAVMSGTTVQSLEVSNSPVAGALGPYTFGAANTPGGPGWTTPDNGTTWVAPVPTPAQQNAPVIFANILNRQSQIQSWITANPNGAVLTAAQTLTLARMLNGLCQLLLDQFGSTNLT